MRVVLTDEQHELREMLRRLFTDACPPSVVRDVKEGRPADDLWRTLAKNGVLGLAVPVEYGGDGAGLFELGLVFEEAGRVLCPTEVYSTLIASLAVGRLGTDEHRSRLLPAFAVGELRATTAMWDSGDVADVRPPFAATRDDAGWTFSGAAGFVPNIERADLLLATAATSDPHQVLAALLTPGGDGWRSTPLTTLAADPQARVDLTHRVVPDAWPVAIDDVHRVAETALALQCMEMVGGASAVLERTVAYVKAREQFGRSLASFQAVHHHIADMRIALDRARLTAWSAVCAVGDGGRARRSVAIAKLQCSEAYKAITLTAHQLHGGMGFVRETDLHLWSERAKVAEIQGGTADVAARWLAEELQLVRDPVGSTPP